MLSSRSNHAQYTYVGRNCYQHIVASDHAKDTRKANFQKTKVNATKTRKVCVDGNRLHTE